MIVFNNRYILKVVLRFENYVIHVLRDFIQKNKINV